MLHKDVSEEKKIEDQIKHVIVLMMENASYDHMLGSFPGGDGINEKNPYFNLDDQGNKIYQKITTAKQMPLDPLHDVPDVAKQISDNNSGFVQNFITHYPTSSPNDRQNIMGYYPWGFLPALHALAAEYTVCDHWFSSLPGPTWPNRFFALSGTSSGRVNMPDGMKDPELREFFYQRQSTIFDRLNEQKISWRSYCGDVPISFVFTHQRKPKNLKNYRDMSDFYKDVKGSPDEFPAFTFIEPKYMGKEQNDDHPPHNTMKAEKLIADTYNAIRSNEKLWNQSLFVVVYDEHGGFYDHVTPPPAIPPDEHKEEGYDFTQLGLRVPAILISPWVKKSVEKTIFDHTSLLRYLTDKWGLGPLGERTAHANSIGVALDFSDGPRKDCLPSIEVKEADLVSPKPHLEKHATNGNQKAMHLFAEFLNKKNSAPLAPFTEMSKVTECMDQFGERLEKNGYLQWGMWFRKKADQHREARAERTVSIVKNFLRQ